MCGLCSSIALGDDREIASKPNGVDFVAHGLQRGDDVVFRSPALLFLLDALRNRVRRHQFLREQAR